jgi:predicted enzyme related to lactoylglutathione lyase
MGHDGSKVTRFDLVTLDALHAPTLVAFWAEALGLHVSETEDDGRWTVLSDAQGIRRLGIQRITDLQLSTPEFVGPRKPRIHLDVVCELPTFSNEVERLLKLGATRLRPDRQEAYGSIATMADPEGNVFDLCAYQ